MAKTVDDHLRDLVNSSGFPLQLAVEHRVETMDRAFGWRVLGSEHPWRDPRTGAPKFLDLILEWGIVRLVVDCKRPKGGEWVFLKRKDQFRPRVHVRCPWMLHVPGTLGARGVGEIGPEPQSYEADFCVVRGKGEDDRPLLERLAAELLAGCDALAEEEHLLLMNSGTSMTEARLVIPTIITSAKLYVAAIDASTVSLPAGEIDIGTTFTEVSLVRFRKTLTTELTPDAQPGDLSEAHRDKQRTVLVIAADKVEAVLADWQLEGSRFSSDYPWAHARRLLEQQALKAAQAESGPK